MVTNGQALAEMVRNADIEARWVRLPATGDLGPGEVVMEMVSRNSWPVSSARDIDWTSRARRPASTGWNSTMARQCVFCGSESDLTREHVLPDWLTEIGLEFEPQIHHVGPINVLPREWTSKPFRTTVRMVCGNCNSGWLSELEGAAKPILAPLIRGEGRRIPYEDQALIAAWTCKTALVSMLISSDDARLAGYGVPPTEYTALYEQRDRMEPLPFSQYWIGTYTGDRRGASVWVTPFVIEAKGPGSPPDIPSGYAITLVVGKLVVQGVRFTTPALQVDLVTEWGFLDIWPPQDTFPWPARGFADDDTVDRMNQTKTFVVQEKGVQLSPFKPATELPPSKLEGGDLIRLPLYCGKHEAFYPAALAGETLRTGRQHVFHTSCECPVGYIIRTESDGAHMKKWGDPAAIVEAYEAWPGEEYAIEDANGVFFFKEEQP